MTAQFRMMSGDLNLRTLYASIFEQQAITFPYLDFNGVSTKYNKLPINLAWLSGIQFRSDEITTGNLVTLRGTNPVQALCYEEYPATSTSAIVGSKYVSTEEGVAPSQTAEVVVAAGTADGGGIMADADIQMVLKNVDTQFNAMFLKGFCSGIYTGIIAITMWTVFSAKHTIRGLASHAMIFTILCLYVLDTVVTSFHWAFNQWAFINNGRNFWTVFLAFVTLSSPLKRIFLVASVPGVLSTLAADGSMIWRCWVVWGQRWLVVLLPILCLLTGTAMKVLEIYHVLNDAVNDVQDTSVFGIVHSWITAYISLNLTTTILCTLLIIYQIITVSHAGMGIRTFRGIIEIIVESAFIYSIALLVYIVLITCNSYGQPYIDILACFARGIAPTLIVGRVAAGHTRPDESWEGSISSSLHFGHSSEDLSQGTIDSDVEGGTLSREEGQSSVIHADSHEEGQEVGGQEDDTGQVVYIEIV
ncbi:hypothetical protein IW261DRAFT_1683955 [Armillaria novae-zelandiae]|uniref:Uncharacterized protein n=1 Tax=Armillaria novae-zelandiae TaxID=153914 RepID=A0AA39NJ89_9AGAR|nr:hypothetical protein IW261DRAFT_1683955 [Armillaria novae-zelandiae]